MRDAVAAIVAAALIFVALSLLTSLHFYRKRHQKARADELARGRTIIVELPTGPALTLFTEDAEHFHYGATPIDKNAITAVRVLINGAPIAAFVSPRWEPDAGAGTRDPAHAETSFEDTSEGILHDRWDVAIETVDATIVVECGAVRERVSQELARKVYDAVKADLEKRC
ncbi:MAG: hypothetical protein ACREF6_16300 [Alphaproteobacteria bacterium]